MIAQHIINALSLGGIYALLALGLAIVFSIMGLINFAHGELMTITGYSLLGALLAGLPFPLAALIAVAAAAVAAMLIEFFAFRPMRKASITSLLLTSFAVSSLLKVVFQNAISARPQAISMPELFTSAQSIGGLTVGNGPMISIAVSLLALLALELFLKHTNTGIAMRAAAEDFSVVRLMGISAPRIIASAFVISGLLAGVAALLWVAQRASVDPYMGFAPVLKAFIAAVIGGLGSLRGAVLGGLLLGALEITLQVLLPEELAAYRDAIVLSGVLLILLVFPNGLLPAAKVQRS